MEHGKHDNHAAGRAKVHEAIDKHTAPRDRFKAFCNTVIANAEPLATAPADVRAAAIADLQAHLDEAWDKING